MDVQLLVVNDCPHERRAADVLRQALDDVGPQMVPFATRVISSHEEAEAAGFAGSPTILINGRDPFAETRQAAGLACRLYRHGDAVSGIPGLEPLRLALRSEAANLDPESGSAVP